MGLLSLLGGRKRMQYMGGAEVVAAWRNGGSDVHVSYPCTVIIIHRALVAVVLCCCRSWGVGRVFQHAHVSWSASLVTTPAAVHLSSHHHRCRWRCSFSGGVVAPAVPLIRTARRRVEGGRSVVMQATPSLRFLFKSSSSIG